MTSGVHRASAWNPLIARRPTFWNWFVVVHPGICVQGTPDTSCTIPL